MNIFKKNIKHTKQVSGSDLLELEVTGMTCDGCATHVIQALEKVEGVMQANVPSWQNGKAVIDLTGDINTEQITKAVENAGYGAKIVNDGGQKKKITHKPIKNGNTDYDLVVIGTGGGGIAASIRAAENGNKVAIIESGVIGGTCVNIGCVPSKTLIRAAEAYHKANHHLFAGIKTSSNGIDWSALIAQKDDLVADLQQNKYVNVLKSYEDRITLIEGHAKLNEQGNILINGQTIKADRVVIATGARPTHLTLDGIDKVEVLDSTSLMDIKEQPKSLIVIGGRAIALELGQALARFGTKVTILQRSNRLVPDHEPEIGDALEEYFREEGIDVFTNATPLAIREENGDKIITAKISGETREFSAEHVLMAVGRTPNTDNLGLEEAGVKVDDKGFVLVDEHLQTSNSKIFAVGDVTTLPNFVYVAAAAGGIAAENALNGNSNKLDLSILPDVIFTDPQIATVGLTEAQAVNMGFDVKVSNLPLEHVPRALAARDTRGFIKLVADNNTDRLLGAHILAAEGGEIIQTAALAIKFGERFRFTVQEFRNMLFPYLTQVEGLKLAAQTFEKDVAQLSCCAG